MNPLKLTSLAIVFACSPAFAAEPTGTAQPAPSAMPAATTTSAKPADCASLQKQYDAANKDKVSPALLKQAQAARAHGAELCAKGNTADGINSLKNALADIGAH